MRSLLILIPCLWLVTYPQPIPAADTPPPVPIRLAEETPPQPVALEAKIEGPEAIRLGDIARLNAYSSTGAKSYKWIVRPEGAKGLIVFPDGKRAFFSNHNPGEYLIILAVGGDNGQVDVTFHSLLIGKSLVPPDTEEGYEDDTPTHSNPTGNTNPPSSPPERPKIAFSSLIATLALQFDKQQAGILAGAFRQSQALIRLDNPDESYVEDHKELIAVTEDLAKRSLGTSYPTWEPVLKKLWESVPDTGNLSQDKAIWLELATGLEALSQGNVK